MESVQEIEHDKENATETIVEISETKSDDRLTQPHNGKKIDRIIVSQYNDPYAITYSKEDNSILGWNIEENGQQRSHVYFKLDLGHDYYIDSFVLYKKFLVFRSGHMRYHDVKVIDLNDDEGRFIQLKYKFGTSMIEFLPNGDLILVSSNGYLKKIYKYSFTNKPTNATLWEYSQIYDIETHKSLSKLKSSKRHHSVYQKKLFFFNKGLMTQWDLRTITFEMQYNLANESRATKNCMINNNQTLLALYTKKIQKIDMYSMKTGVYISSYGLLIFNKDNKKYRFIDPFHPSNAVDITNDIITSDSINDENIVITKLNKKFYIKENNVWVTDGLKENSFQQMLNTPYHYALPIRNMLRDLENEVEFPEDGIIRLADSELFRFNLKKVKIDHHDEVEVKGLKKSQINDEWKETQNAITLYGVVSYKQLNNQDLALITNKTTIRIYTIAEDHLRLRYYYKYDYSIHQIYLQSSLPPPLRCYEFKDLLLSIINNPVKFEIEALNSMISEKNGDAVQLAFNKIIELIQTEDYNCMKLLLIISSILPDLYDRHYSSLVMKYILYTSILLDPSCSSVENLETSLYAYSKNVHIKKCSNDFKRVKTFLYEEFNDLIHLKSQEKNPAISFIVPFPQICKYKGYNDYNNPWNEILYKPKSILFCNIDSNNFYKWWNFAAIIDFKWKTFGKFYYFLIWFVYTIFYLCFALAYFSDLHRRILFIISILLGFIHLSFEIRQFLWNWKIYVKNPWNLFDVGAYSLPIIASIYWLINQNPPLEIMAISILLLNFKFLLFFQVFQSYGKYFAIIIGVAKEVFPFLVVLFFIILGFGFAFFVLLSSTNPMDLTTEYSSINSDGTITPTLVQIPDSNTNMFSQLSTSFLAMYLFLTGDSGSLSSWSYTEEPIMTFLLFVFTFSTVIYLMNLFIGLLNIAIENYNKHEEFLLLKARIIMEIELFYMSHSQRHCDEWFPDLIYYSMPVDEVRRLINAIDDHRTEFNSPPFISKRLRKLIEVPEPINEAKSIDDLKQQIKQIENKNDDKLKQISDELRQTNELIKNMQELLNSFVKNSNPNNDTKNKENLD